MNRKRKFLEAVRILAPEDITINKLAASVKEESLPLFPGGAALEFVARMAGLSTHSVRLPRHTPAAFPLTAYRRRYCPPGQACAARAEFPEHETRVLSE